MGPLYAYSLIPVLSVALLLFFTATLRGRNARGLSFYCLGVAVWSGVLLLIHLPGTSTFAVKLAAAGTFVAAGYLHAAYDVTRQKRYGLVWLAYAVAFGITAMGVVRPGVLYDPLTLKQGPVFWPAMALAVVAATIPLAQLVRAFRVAEPSRRPLLLGLLVSGVLGYSGTMSNALLLANGIALPFGIFLMLGSMLVLANVIRAHQSEGDRRLLDRSLLYSALAALLSAGFLFGVLSLMSAANDPFVREYRLGALFLLFMAALAFEPLRQQIQESLGRRLITNRAHSSDLARALVEQEQHADQAARLAELGAFSSAVAHEVRNPLGVLAAHLKLLERSGASAETLSEMKAQIDRAGRFVDDLLKYGRPRPLELRLVDVAATCDLAFSTARQGFGPNAPEVQLEKRHAAECPPVEADQAQLSQMLVILFDNALLALAGAPSQRLRITSAMEGATLRLTLEDGGPGISPEVMPRLFQPFVTGRKRDSPRSGTGLGLAIARGIVERHGGTIRAGKSEELGGARFDLTLPRHQPVLAAALSSTAERITP